MKAVGWVANKLISRSVSAISFVNSSWEKLLKIQGSVYYIKKY